MRCRKAEKKKKRKEKRQMDRRAWKKRSLHLAFWIQTHVRCCKDLSKWGEKNRDIEEWNAGRHWLLSVISVAWYENGNHVENLCSTTSNRPSRSPLPLHSSGEGLIGPGEVNSSGPLTFGSYCFFSRWSLLSAVSLHATVRVRQELRKWLTANLPPVSHHEY